MNSKLLVSAQFLAIGAIMIPKETVCITGYWWVEILLSCVGGLWILLHNRLGNFNIVPEIKEQAKLIMTGPYRFVRHPMYGVLILFMVGIVLWHFSVINLVSLCIMIVAVVLKARKEERLWLAEDEAYARYQKESKMLIPFIL